MKYSAYNISLDIHEHASQAVIKAKKSDTGRKLHITLRAGGTPYTIEDNCYAAFKATKPDNTILFNACTIENNEIIYEFTENTCTSVGRLRCEIALYGQDGKLITSPCFTMLVDGLIYPDEHIESTDEFSALTELISGTLEATNAARQATENAVDATENAIKSSVSADLSAAKASQAAQNASTASENANEATRRANEAIGMANEATNAANNATSNANNAAQNANETTTNLVHIVKNAMAIGKVKGVSVSMDDAVELGFVGFRIFGKTTQDGTPTPDAPVDLVSVGDNGNITVNVNDAQSMTIATPNGLPGIPVTSGGNYTDANGKQWICDEIDFARGVYVQNVSENIVDGVNNPVSKNDNESGSRLYYIRVTDKGLGSAGFCTHFSHVDGYPTGGSNNGKFNVTVADGIVFFSGYGIVSGDNSTQANANEFNEWLNAQNEAGTPVTLLYKLATPTETPLSDEELAAYSALYTYRDNTTVSNDAGAYMELEYVMDAKKYIDSLVASSTIHQATVE